jgi:nicotianamine synthase
VVRETNTLRQVLELSAELDDAGLEVLVEVHPWTKVVNSVVVLRVKER